MLSNTPPSGEIMRTDIVQIYEASMRTREKLDADQRRFGPERREIQRIHEPRQTNPPSELAELLTFLRDHFIDRREPAGPVMIWFKDGKPYEMTDAEKSLALEAASSQHELELFWSTPEGRRRLAEIEHATAKQRNGAEDILRRYGIFVDGEIDWPTYVRALRKIGKPLKDFLKPVFDREIENDSQPSNAGKQPIAYIADLAELLDLVESKSKKKPGYWRRAQSLELRSDRLCGLPGWLRQSRQQELEVCDSIDATTCIRLYAPFRAVHAGFCFCIWRGTPIPYFAELGDFYRQSCRPRRYCALSRRPKIADSNREERDSALAAARKNREMVEHNECAEYFLGAEPRPRPKALPVQDRSTLGNKKGDSPRLDEILQIAKSEANRAVRGLSSGPSPATTVRDRFIDDLYQEAALVALTETQTHKRLPLHDAPLRRRIRSRLKREIGRLRMRDYHYGEGLPDTDAMTAEEEVFEMIRPSMHSPFDLPEFETIIELESTAEQRACAGGNTESSEIADLDEPIDLEEPADGAAMRVYSEAARGRSDVDLERMAEGILDERELAMVMDTYEERTGAEIGKRLGCHQSTVQRALKNIADRATLRIRSHPPKLVERAPSTRFLPSLDASAY